MPHSGFSACARLCLWLLCVCCSRLSDVCVCVCVCVRSGIYPCALVTIDKETSFLHSAGNVKPKHIDKVQVILVFHDALFPSRKSAVTHFCNTQAHRRTRTHTDLSPSGHTKCGQNRIALCSSFFFFFWLWADHTSLSYIQYSTYINFLILNGLLNYLWGWKI